MGRCELNGAPKTVRDPITIPAGAHDGHWDPGLKESGLKESGLEQLGRSTFGRVPFLPGNSVPAGSVFLRLK